MLQHFVRVFIHDNEVKASVAHYDEKGKQTGITDIELNPFLTELFTDLANGKTVNGVVEPPTPVVEAEPEAVKPRTTKAKKKEK